MKFQSMLHVTIPSTHPFRGLTLTLFELGVTLFSQTSLEAIIAIPSFASSKVSVSLCETHYNVFESIWGNLRGGGRGKS